MQATGLPIPALPTRVLRPRGADGLSVDPAGRWLVSHESRGAARLKQQLQATLLHDEKTRPRTPQLTHVRPRRSLSHVYAYVSHVSSPPPRPPPPLTLSLSRALFLALSLARSLARSLSLSLPCSLSLPFPLLSLSRTTLILPPLSSCLRSLLNVKAGPANCRGARTARTLSMSASRRPSDHPLSPAPPSLPPFPLSSLSHSLPYARPPSLPPSQPPSLPLPPFPLLHRLSRISPKARPPPGRAPAVHSIMSVTVTGHVRRSR